MMHDSGEILTQRDGYKNPGLESNPSINACADDSGSSKMVRYAITGASAGVSEVSGAARLPTLTSASAVT